VIQSVTTDAIVANAPSRRRRYWFNPNLFPND